ncbi:uridine phosphorylase 1 [Trichinella spiralis]|uniref:uridine phosphorylase 1 n=1 Tax=Trichinella spiralis TaxID=6334 RepID=UPI0001EFCCC5|nr:uridine phosphorylase 1 [Trichinella spiralis]
MTKDVLYHFGFSTDEDDLVALFNNVKFVLCGDSAGRMLKLATFLCKQLKNSNGDEPTNLTRTDRYVLYKVSNCICISVCAHFIQNFFLVSSFISSVVQLLNY